MSREFDDYPTRPRDSVRERELARRLRSLPEDERFAIIQRLIERDSYVGLLLANACLRRKELFRVILLQGLVAGDPSNIRWWMKCVISRLGCRQVIQILTDELDNNPSGVGNALYWLTYYIPDSDAGAPDALGKLTARAEIRGLIKKPRMVYDDDDPGIVRFGNIYEEPK